MISSIRHKQSISWTFLNDAMAISAKEMPKNHTDKERFAAALSMQDGDLRPVPNAAPLMCRTKLNTVRLWSDFGATVDSDGVLASDLIREGHGKQFSMRKICVPNSLTLSK